MSTVGLSWIITHGISGGFLTYDMFKAHPVLACIDECHYTSDAVVVYTYVHFTVQVSLKVMQSFMETVKSERHIILFEIFGYNSLATSSFDDVLADHIGFKILLDHYLTKNPAFKSCTMGTAGVKRGLLWRSDVLSRMREHVQKRSKAFGDFFAQMEKQLAEYKQKADLVDLMREQMEENEARMQSLRERIQRDHEFIKKLKHEEFVAFVLKDRIRSLDQAMQDILLAPDHEGLPL